MPPISMRQLPDRTAENGYDLSAFNVNNLEQAQAVMEAVREASTPIILQTSVGACKHADESFIKHLIQAVVGAYPEIPLVIRQDHDQNPAICQGAVDLGFGSVMMDDSLHEDGKTPADFDCNVDVTRRAVEIAHKADVTAEDELGYLDSLETSMAGEEDRHGAENKLDRSSLLTGPEKTAQFVKATQLDTLAIAIGTSHGACKFTCKPADDILAISRVKETHARIPNTHLAMHGSSSVPQELLAIINQYGGKMRRTYDVPVEEIQETIEYGVRKVNIDTDIRLTVMGTVRKFLAKNPDKFDAREWLEPAREAAKQICKARYIQFSCGDQAGKVKPISLFVIAQKHQSGDLAQMVQ